jgi:ferredoxin-NADP reductase
VLALYVADLDGKWLRHPYTVSWAEGARVGILFRVIPSGRGTPTMAALRPGETVRFGGQFGAPVAALVPDDVAEMVGVSTGTGVGPLHGFAAAALAAGFDRPITLHTGFRTEADIPLRRELEALAARHPRLTWLPTLTAPGAGWAGLTGRVTATLPPRAPRNAHFHLVGNGAMVAELRGGLLAAGVPTERVTMEVYFNRVPSPDQGTVAAIGAAIAAGWAARGM